MTAGSHQLGICGTPGPGLCRATVSWTLGLALHGPRCSTHPCADHDACEAPHGTNRTGGKSCTSSKRALADGAMLSAWTAMTVLGALDSRPMTLGLFFGPAGHRVGQSEVVAEVLAPYSSDTFRLVLRSSVMQAAASAPGEPGVSPQPGLSYVPRGRARAARAITHAR